MIRVGLVGWPVAHSLSPGMHAAAFETAGLHGSYERVETRPEDLTETVNRCRAAGWAGLNVTIPHKQAALALCTTVSPLARRAGAVNTLTFQSDGVAGDNTDIPGLLTSLGPAVRAGRHALILGAGGAARAATVGLLDAGLAVTLVNRTSERAAALASELGCGHRALEDLGSLDIDVVVNTTAAGMSAPPNTPEWATAQAFFARVPLAHYGHPTVMDMVYTPAVTPLLALARQAGCPTVGGIEMLVGQGALAFERWTGVAAASVLQAMRQSVIGIT